MNIAAHQPSDQKTAKTDVCAPIDLSGFVQGDTTGKDRREAAMQDAITQGLTQPEGSFRAKIYALQANVASLPEIDFPLQHLFVPGAYARTIFLPKGSVIIGKIHKHQHFNILSQGQVDVVTESGGVERITGPKVMVSPAGTKRAVYALEDTIWTTIHLTNETDLTKIEEEVIAKTYAEYEQFAATQKTQIGQGEADVIVSEAKVAKENML